MIYVILNNSYELDEVLTSTIVYVGTDKDKAIEYFDRNFGNTKELSDEKWCYDYDLVEYPDGWHRFEDGEKIIKHIDNCADEI